jgi:hypothetical protein
MQVNPIRDFIFFSAQARCILENTFTQFLGQFNVEMLHAPSFLFLSHCRDLT